MFFLSHCSWSMCWQKISVLPYFQRGIICLLPLDHTYKLRFTAPDFMHTTLHINLCLFLFSFSLYLFYLWNLFSVATPFRFWCSQAYMELIFVWTPFHIFHSHTTMWSDFFSGTPHIAGKYSPISKEKFFNSLLT